MVVSVTESKLLMKMLQVTFTGGPVKRRREMNPKLCFVPLLTHNVTTENWYKFSQAKWCVDLQMLTPSLCLEYSSVSHSSFIRINNYAFLWKHMDVMM